MFNHTNKRNSNLNKNEEFSLIKLAKFKNENTKCLQRQTGCLHSLMGLHFEIQMHFLTINIYTKEINEIKASLINKDLIRALFIITKT